ncbi:glycosyltransferase [Methanobrevibacter sp. TMH8]|uniref:glycosyltransferase n=1 Tax=Methanobrevibacter sp. TMH8 TaxID=2848611 RepID=UPI001CCC551B|nr:glycosyltransferase [Methanobrevibacter sp. TMH8]MBZ9570445.1 glycosyltransferase [Methanobrevibacter sp. TMH8]
MDKVKVSVIVPVYNSEKYLKECLDSLLNQTLTEIEVICVDDGSTDSSPEILEIYSKKDKRIKVITQENKDVGPAREAGLKIAVGEYVTFADNDDWFAIDAFEKLYINAKSNDSDVVIFKIVFYYSDNDSYTYPKSLNLEKYFEEDIDYNNFVFKAKNIKEQVMNNLFAPWFKFYRLEFLKSYNFYFKEKITYPDVPFHVQVLLKANKISFCPEYLYFYRRNHQESMLLISKDTPRIFDIFEVIDEVQSFLISNNLFESYELEFYEFKLQQINFWLLRCGKSYQDEYFLKSKEEISNIEFSKIESKLRRRYKKIYSNIINSNSFQEVILLNEKRDSKINVIKSKNKKSKNKTEKKIENQKFQKSTSSSKILNFLRGLK